MLWNPNPAPVTGYRVHTGPATGVYTNHITLSTNSYRFTNSVPLYAVVTALNGVLESDYSVEILLPTSLPLVRTFDFVIESATTVTGPWTEITNTALRGQSLTTNQLFLRGRLRILP